MDFFTEQNTNTNLPAQIELYTVGGNTYDFLFIAKGGGSANKTFLFQQTKALLNPDRLYSFINEKIKVCYIYFIIIRHLELQHVPLIT